MRASSTELQPAVPQLLGDFLPIDARARSAVLVGGGCLIGFVVAAWAVGALAERRFARHPLSAFLVFQLGSLIVFACGLTGLMLTLDVGPARAAALGWLPFIPGDLIKTTFAALLFPAAWAAAHRFDQAD